jgi:hypothetical protein
LTATPTVVKKKSGPMRCSMFDAVEVEVEALPHRIFQLRECQLGAACAQLGVEVFEGLRGGRVDVGDRLRSRLSRRSC